MSNASVSIVKAGTVVGIVLGGWHLFWSALVAVGAAQAVIDFIFWLHFIKPVYMIEPFEAVRAIILVFVTAGLGFLLGAAGAAA